MTGERPEDGPLVGIQVIIEDSWPPDVVAGQLANAARRFGECGVALSFTQEREENSQPVLVFVSTLEVVDGLSIEGRALTLQTPKRAEIAWAAPGGAPLDHKQTAAHELGHVFGLLHTPLHNINLMAPHGCDLCRFTPAQCRIIAKTAFEIQ